MQPTMVEQMPRRASSRHASAAEQHIGLVYEAAHRVWRRSGRTAVYDELVSAGKIGLMRALAGYDSTRGIAFSTYALRRIEGEIQDDLRRSTAGSRRVRGQMRAVRSAETSLRVLLSRAPLHHEVAERLGIDAEELWRWKMAGERTLSVSLDASAGDDRGDDTADSSLMNSLVCSGSEEIEDRLERTWELERVTQEMARLPERERMVLVLHFAKELKLREIGEILGVSESRVSQIRTAALARLRERLAPLRCA